MGNIVEIIKLHTFSVNSLEIIDYNSAMRRVSQCEQPQKCIATLIEHFSIK